MSDLEISLRSTRETDLDFVLRQESDPENSPFVGSWTRDRHRAAISADDWEHWIITAGAEGRSVGYLIVVDLRADGRGVHLKRMVVSEKRRGIGRRALERLSVHLFERFDPPFIWLDVLADNERAQAAYRAAGFSPREFPENEIAEWAEAADGFDDGSVLMFRDRPE